MRLLYIDIDTLRPDHLGCYGYGRDTSPNIDRIAESGVRFEEVYASDSPCLPSRTALFAGSFGLRTGVVNHGGSRAEPFPSGAARGRQHPLSASSWPSLLRQAGMWTATVSTFGERHSAYHWYAGFNEVHNLGTGGMETADMVHAVAERWLRRHGRNPDWFLHVHFWDPHTPYRTPQSYGNPFAGQPFPAWIDDEVIAGHRRLTGPHSAQEVTGFGSPSGWGSHARQPEEIRSTEDVRAMFDGYDTGVRYVDHYVGRLHESLLDLGIDDETAILVSSDHGEALGELGIYGDHQTADLHTHRVPLILRWPGVRPGVDRSLRYQFDVAASVASWVGSEVPSTWDGAPFAAASQPFDAPRNELVLSCASWTVQRAVRFDRWLCVWTYHDAFHGYPDVMLFDRVADPHEQTDQAPSNPEVVSSAERRLDDWLATNLARSPAPTDPLQTVLDEGGGLYVRGRLDDYIARLEATGRKRQADSLASRSRPVGSAPSN